MEQEREVHELYCYRQEEDELILILERKGRMKEVKIPRSEITYAISSMEGEHLVVQVYRDAREIINGVEITGHRNAIAAFLRQLGYTEVNS